MPLSGAEKSKQYETRQADRGRIQKHLWVPKEFGQLLEQFAAECLKMHERGEPPPAEPPQIRPRLNATQIANIQERLDARGQALLNRTAEVIRKSDISQLDRLAQRIQLCEDALGH